YQTAPLERAKGIVEELKKMRTIEVGIARQNNIPKSRVLDYELVLDDMVNTYHGLYFLQRHGSMLNIALPDDERVSRIAKREPPFNFLEYLDFMEDVDNCHKELERQQKSLADAKDELQNAMQKRDLLERKYRLTASKIEDNDGDMLMLNLEMKEIKAQLEDAMILHVYYRSVTELSTSAIAEIESKLAVIEPLLDKIRANVKSEESDFKLLDGKIFKKTSELYSDIEKMDKQYAKLSEQRANALNASEATKFYLDSEVALIERDANSALNMAEFQLSMRVVWNTIADLIEGRLDIKKEKALLDKTEYLLSELQKQLEYCNVTRTRIRETKDEAERRFLNPMVKISDADRVMLEAFMESMEDRDARQTRYVSDLSVVRSQYRYLYDEVQSILRKQPTDKQVRRMWYDNTESTLQKELFHFGDYPVTLGKLFSSLAIFAFWIIVTYFIGYLVKRREEKRSRWSRHNILIIHRLIIYVGFALAVLFALWHLNIPVTAFAFFGGALAIAIGFGTQKILGDFLSGLMLIFQRKIRVGDEVIIGEYRGFVREMTIHNTVLRCQQSRDLVIPNTKVQESPVVNLTLHDSTDRIEVNVSVAYDSDVKRALDIVREVLEDDKDVLKSPKFRIFFEDFEDSSIKITAWFFIDLKKIWGKEAASAVREKIFERFNAEGIEIPFPQTDVHIKKDLL
ncbi:MAG: mechanosensitive ion channel, partial [Synergistaceae bacterium]|nr:mechanosensitive ion channel [Synergistaceae bacterium]